ncbi:MAG: sigma-54-dependent Fis family transcriptional regulator [Bacteroidales bacterium]|nr:sigma-54-dependent Fis family transcriptional regulator [Bacteroidales bacterium]
MDHKTKRTKPTLLIVDDEERSTHILKINFRDVYHVLVANNGEEALSLLEHEPVNLILTDLRMPEMTGNELLRKIRENNNHIPVIIMTAYGTVENAVESMKMGAFDYILKPLDIENLSLTIERALNYSSLLNENVRLKEQLKQYEGFRQIITINPEMNRLLELTKQVATAKVPVLIEGESGTGKELFARAIHYLSPRASKDFISINCGAIPAELIESELFGHEKGAFTGASAQKKGKFELAHHGTLFLDEIGELPKNMQVKLLRAIEEQQFTRVGGTQTIKTDIRFVAATNRDLNKEVEEGRFREDLYYRLKVVNLRILPLRERKDDIPLLVRHFLEKHRKDIGKTIRHIDDRVMEMFMNYFWPGNVRELENIVMHTMLFTPADTLVPDALPVEFVNQAKQNATATEETIPETKEALQKERKKRYEEIDKKLEYNFLDRILQKTHGNITRAAELTGYDRRQLQNLIHKYHINAQNYKKGT